MSLFKLFGTNKSLEEEGIEVTYPANEDGTVPTFIVARMGKTNKAYSRELQRAMKPYRQQIKYDTLSNEQAEEVLLGVFIKSVLKGWRNVQNEKGKDVEYTYENAKKLFTQLPDLYEELQERAQSMATFRIEEREDVAKNS